MNNSKANEADAGQPLTQELLNSMMRNPGDVPHSAATVLPACPKCGERYCGDGAQPCVDCAVPIELTDKMLEGSKDEHY